MDGLTNRRTDIASNKVTCPQLKEKEKEEKWNENDNEEEQIAITH